MPINDGLNKSYSSRSIYGSAKYSDHSDNENFEADDTTPLYSSARSEAPKGWDVFVVQQNPDEDETLNSKWLENILKFLKLCAYIVTFAVVLSTAILSKVIVLLMTSLIKPNRTEISVCSQGIPGLERDKHYQAIFNATDPERVTWIWCLIVILVVPELMTLFRSARICTFKSFTRPTKLAFILLFIMETLHTIGIVMLVFLILPSLDVVKGAMLTNCFCLLPALLSLISRHSGEIRRVFKTLLDLLSLLIQISACVIWPFMESKDNQITQYIPLTCILISFGWWENYIDKRSPFKFVRSLSSVKENLHRARYFSYIFISIWKILLILFTTVFIRYLIDGNVFYLFSQFKSAFSQHKILIVQDRNDFLTFVSSDQNVGIDSEWIELDSNNSAPIWLTLIQISAAWLCYVFGKFACRIYIQSFSYAFPLSLTVPITISLLIASCGLHFENTCYFKDLIPRYVFWTCPNENFLSDISLFNLQALCWLLWLLSQIWTTIHIWKPKCERLATTEKIFVNPMYCGVIVDQSLVLNRRRNEEEIIKSEDINLDAEGLTQEASQHYETISEHPEDKKSTIQSSDHIIRILACATMWHETHDEMIQMLKSVMRMDEDQCARRNAQKYLRIVDPDYYEFEVNIFFDDAFELCDENDEDMMVNRFVKMFFGAMDDAASNVHQCNIKLKPPKKYPTPYGGRLEWTMPGGNKLIAHLKDKIKIRHRKRWSQVMYMYYLLGHRLMELSIDVNRKALMAENTFILTLDGDINFRPHAVQLLVDLMKKNRKLGAACGRIHPVGSGPMVWYQKFEYAVGHWLQKSTEHMIGCVLCSPGCFSLFRAKALMDDNVMRRYTIKSEEALHYVQFDQGEDRWLCTLLLQRGYRVEYSAASDAYTHCPEGFGEFYTQRRRWAPSTIANIMDLLADSKRTIAINDNISLPYIIYQGMLMIGTVLGPGTIFLMLVGAMVAAFRISNWYSFQLNMIPIFLFALACFTLKNDLQILFAQILSAAYALLMMAVFVGTAIQMTEDGVGSPSAVFFLALTGSFVVAAVLHPQEFSCLIPAFLYWLSIPCMYLLLIIYSLINLNVVTWGTREVQTKKTKAQIEEEKKEAEEIKKKNILGFLRSDQKDDEDGGIVFSLGNLFKCMFFTSPKPNDDKIHLMKIEDHLNQLTNKMNNIEKHIEPTKRKGSSISGRNAGKFSDNLSTVTENDDDNENQGNTATHHGEFSSGDESETNTEQGSGELANKRDDLINPYWMEDKQFKNCPVVYLPPQELQFWHELIEKYLFPIDQDKVEQARIAADLKELRNRMVFFFFMINALFVLIVFLLQLNKDILHVDWPFGVRENITFVPETNEIRIEKEYLEMEPIGLVFVFFFGSILVIQFIGMLFHRFGTLSHILASVEFNCFSSKVEDISDDAYLDKNAIQIARQLQRLKGIDEDDKSDDSKYGNLPEKRKTIFNLEKRKQQKHRIGTLDVAFRKRFMNITANGEGTPVLGGIRRRETINALERRKNNVIAGERNQMETLGVKNEFVRGRQRSTLDSKQRKRGNGNYDNGAVINASYEDDISDDGMNGSLKMNTYSSRKDALDTFRKQSNNLNV